MSSVTLVNLLFMALISDQIFSNSFAKIEVDMKVAMSHGFGLRNDFCLVLDNSNGVIRIAGIVTFVVSLSIE